MTIINKLLKNNLVSKDIFFIIIIIFLQTIIHFKYISLPPGGYHQWRQTQTLSVARNFFEEDMNIFKPRVDSRGQYSGISGMEFPIVNYTLAVVYKIFGYSYSAQRLTVLLFSILTAIGCYYFIKLLFGSKKYGFLGSVFLIFSPLFSYYSICFMPDVPMLGFMFFSLFFLLKWYNNEKDGFFYISIFLLALAALIKLGAFIIFPLVILLLYKKIKKLSLGKSWGPIAALAMCFIIVVSWYGYARYLSITYNNYDFKLESNFPYPLQIVLPVLKKVFIQWLPELYINYAEFIFLIIGLFALKKINIPYFKITLGSLVIGITAYMTGLLPMLLMHDYYMVPVLPILIMLVTLGFKYFYENVNKRKYFKVILTLLLILVPVLGMSRSLSRLERIKDTKGLFTIENNIENKIPMKSLVVVASDESPSIYLYFAHRKGWSVTENIPDSQFEDIIGKGAKYLISDSRNLENRLEIKKHLSPVSHYGEFNIYELN